jgi:hypothetical protein
VMPVMKAFLGVACMIVLRGDEAWAVGGTALC